jgi:hypothetical protein
MAHVVFGTRSKPTNIDLGNLNGSNGFKIASAGQQTFTGLEVSAAGDMNGDGYREILVSAVGNGDKGQVFVLFGSASGFPALTDLSNPGTLGVLRIEGKAGDYAGQTLDRAGDINGDGFDDIILGGARAAPGNQLHAGASYVVFGSASLTTGTMSVSALDGTNGFAINGVAEEDQAGNVAGAGDVNGDGLSDVLIGAPGAEVGTTNYAGSSFLLFGRLPLVST